MAVYVHGVYVKLFFVVIYRPGSTAVCSPFFDDFADVVEHIAIYAAPTIIVCDVNIHLDDISASHTVQFNDILDGVDLVQHVAGPTHHTGHTLDVIITQTATEVFVSVKPQSMSDHSLIVANIMPEHTIQLVSTTIIKQKWTQFDVDKFEKELAESDLITSPSTDCREYFTHYNKTLRALLDKHAPLKSTVQCSRATSTLVQFPMPTSEGSISGEVILCKTLSYLISGMADPVLCPAMCVPDSLHRLLVNCNRELF